MTKCLIAIGCNQGDCHDNIRRSIERIGELPETSVLANSSLLETAPVGSFQGQFLNGALLIDTSLEPGDLMSRLLLIEIEAGRNRAKDPGNRPLDLDILLFGQEVLASDILTVPHPRMSFRRFVLEPAAEIAPDMVHPLLHLSLAELFQRIARGKNVVAILVPGDFELGDFNLETANATRWLIPGTHNDLLLNLSDGVLARDGWLVVLSGNSELLSRIRDEIKLLITVDLDLDRPPNDGFPDTYCGPRWSLKKNSADQLRQHALTAIQAMQPAAESADSGQRT